jgi:large subunit ribosomal protein L13
MNTLSYKTISVTKEAAAMNKEWVVIDAADQVVGRLCTKVAKLLRGKYKPTFTPHVDCGDNVIIINAKKVKLTGNHPKTKKNYYNVSGYNGGLRTRTSGVMLEEYPIEMVERAVWGMVPKGRLGRQMVKKLYVYEGAEHKQVAQNPVVLDLSK